MAWLKVRALVVGAVTFLCLPITAHTADPTKVLRISSHDIASLDPQQGTDLYSTRVATEIFEALYQFDYLVEPAKVISNTAGALPVITEGGKTWTIKLKQGILFADAPAFKGKSRELVAQDYVYSTTTGR
jgi:ABC-type transport system substrate-binding protein